MEEIQEPVSTTILEDGVELVEQKKQQLSAMLQLLTYETAEWAAPMIDQHLKALGLNKSPDLVKLAQKKVRICNPIDIVKLLTNLQHDHAYLSDPGARLFEMKQGIFQYFEDLDLETISPGKYRYWCGSATPDGQMIPGTLDRFQDSRILIGWFNSLFLHGRQEEFATPLFKLQWAIQDGIVTDPYSLIEWQRKHCPVRWTPARLAWKARLKMPPVQRDVPHRDLEYQRGLYV